jgi:hypothetical protein
MHPMIASIDWTATGVIIGAAGAVLASIIAVVTLWVQTQSLGRQLKSANYQQIVGAFSDFSKIIVDTPELDPLIYGTPYTAAATPEMRDKVDWAIGIRFGWFESVVVQRKEYRLLSENIAQHWINILEKELESPAMQRHWEKYHDYYHPELRVMVAELLNRIALRRALLHD